MLPFLVLVKSEAAANAWYSGPCPDRGGGVLGAVSDGAAIVQSARRIDERLVEACHRPRNPTQNDEEPADYGRGRAGAA